MVMQHAEPHLIGLPGGDSAPPFKTRAKSGHSFIHSPWAQSKAGKSEVCRHSTCYDLYGYDPRPLVNDVISVCANSLLSRHSGGGFCNPSVLLLDLIHLNSGILCCMIALVI